MLASAMDELSIPATGCRMDRHGDHHMAMSTMSSEHVSSTPAPSFREKLEQGPGLDDFIKGNTYSVYAPPPKVRGSLYKLGRPAWLFSLSSKVAGMTTGRRQGRQRRIAHSWYIVGGVGAYEEARVAEARGSGRGELHAHQEQTAGAQAVHRV